MSGPIPVGSGAQAVAQLRPRADIEEEVEHVPYVARKAGRRWAIVNRNTGRVAGYSSTKQKAQASARARNAGHRG
jgi:hypothetical protein